MHLESQTRIGRTGLVYENALSLKGLDVRPADADKKILGLDGKLFCRGLTEFLKDSPLETSVEIRGLYDALTVRMDEKGLIDSVHEGIRRTGDRLLQEEMDRQLARIQNKVDEKFKEGEKKLDEKMDGLNKKLRGKMDKLLGGRKKKKK